MVFAATSLTEAFNKIGAQFEAANPGVNVKFNYNGSARARARWLRRSR